MSSKDVRGSTPGGPAPLTMNSVTGKLVLALIRDKDYAHAGEEEAIELALAPVVSRCSDRWLDVGCGIGGTAHFVLSRYGQTLEDIRAGLLGGAIFYAKAS